MSTSGRLLTRKQKVPTTMVIVVKPTREVVDNVPSKNGFYYSPENYKTRKMRSVLKVSNDDDNKRPGCKFIDPADARAKLDKTVAAEFGFCYSLAKYQDPAMTVLLLAPVKNSPTKSGFYICPKDYKDPVMRDLLEIRNDETESETEDSTTTTTLADTACPEEKLEVALAEDTGFSYCHARYQDPKMRELLKMRIRKKIPVGQKKRGSEKHPVTQETKKEEAEDKKADPEKIEIDVAAPKTKKRRRPRGGKKKHKETTDSDKTSLPAPEREESDKLMGGASGESQSENKKEEIAPQIKESGELLAEAGETCQTLDHITEMTSTEEESSEQTSEAAVEPKPKKKKWRKLRSFFKGIRNLFRRKDKEKPQELPPDQEKNQEID